MGYLPSGFSRLEILMTVRVIWGRLERVRRSDGSMAAARKFEIAADDGSVTGQLLVGDGDDAVVKGEIRRRLRTLLCDAADELRTSAAPDHGWVNR
jgi:hypothetical protein